MNLRFKILAPLLVLAAGCGTVVGNPKKPKDDKKTDAIVFKIPEIEFEVPSGAKDDDASLRLQDEAFENGDKTLLTAWGKRLDRAIARVNATARRMNAIFEKQEDDVLDGVLVFKGRGDEGQLSGKITRTGDGDQAENEAVLCYGGQLLTHLKWNEAGTRIELTRDFAVKSVVDDDVTSLVSTLNFAKGDSATVEFATQGELDGALFTESSRGEKTAAGFNVRSVAGTEEAGDRPADGAYDADRYLVGQVTDAGTEFVGFYEGFPVPCRNGFDETAEDLWKPGVGRPRFCVGRPIGGKRFKTVSEYHETLGHLQPIGVEPKASLHAVKFQDGLSCE